MATYCDFKIQSEDLDALDWFGQSDPYFIIKVPIDQKNLINSQGIKTTTYKDAYVSEIIPNQLNPEWRPFRLDFYELCRGDVNTELLIECYDWDRIGSSDFIGSFKVEVKYLLNKKKIFELISKKGKRAGNMFITTKTSMSHIVFCNLKCFAIDLDSSDSCDPYFVIKIPCNIEESQTLLPFVNIIYPSPPLVRGKQSHPTSPGYREIYESVVIPKTVSPVWPPFKMSFYDLCRGQPDTKLLIECYNYNQILSNTLIGSTEVSVRNLLEAGGALPLLLISPNGNKSGIFILECIFK